MKPIKLTIALLFLCIFCSSYSFSQVESDTTKTEASSPLYLIVKNDGTEYTGKILKDDGREVLIETKELGKLYIQKSSIKSITLIQKPEIIKTGDVRGDGPFSTRYYFTTNALPIKKGEDYAMIHLYGPEIHFALSNRFSLGVMTSWIASPFALAAKYSFTTKNENVNFALGTILATSGYINQARGYGGLHWGTATLGDRKTNISLSLGYGYLQAGFRQNNVLLDNNNTIFYKDRKTKNGTILSIAGIAAVGKRASFIFDCMIAFSQHDRTIKEYQHVPYTGPGGYTEYAEVEVTIHETGPKVSSFFMPGMRFQKSENKAFQFALAGVIEWRNINGVKETISFPVPMVSWFFKF